MRFKQPHHGGLQMPRVVVLSPEIKNLTWMVRSKLGAFLDQLPNTANALGNADMCEGCSCGMTIFKELCFPRS